MAFLKNLAESFNNLPVPQKNGILNGLNSGMYLSYPAIICGTVATCALIDMKTGIALSALSIATFGLTQMAGLQAYRVASEKCHSLNPQDIIDDTVEPDSMISKIVAIDTVIVATSPQIYGILDHLLK